MKKSITTVCLLVVLAHNLKAQADSTVPRSRKNEIGMNIGPMVLIMMGSRPDPQPIGIVYKRVLSEHWAFRTTWNMNRINPEFYVLTTSETKTTDSTRLVNASYKNDLAYTGRAGIEYRRRGRFCSLVGGMDLQGRYVENATLVDQYFSRIDSNSSAFLTEPYMNSMSESKRVYDEKNVRQQIGLGFSFGLMVPLSSRWLVNTQFRMDMWAGSQRSTKRDYEAGTKTSNYSQVFDFETSAPIGEISLLYRF